MTLENTRGKDTRAFALLGGTVLFGYLGCQAPDTVPTSPPGAGRDTAAAGDTVGIVVRPRPEPEKGPLVFREGPTLGEACAEPDAGACTKEGMLLRCEGGIRKEMAPLSIRPWYCVPGDTVVKERGHMGFTGIDRAGPRRAPELILRPALA